MRPPSYAPADYYNEFSALLVAFGAAGVDTRRLIQGATYCCGETTWGADLPTYLSRFAPSLASLSYHRYPDTNNATTSVRALLSDACAAGAADTVAPFARAAQATHTPFLIGEGNSVNGGGLPNISDTWASALWATDVMFNVAAVGARRWNWHGGPRGPYAPVVYSNASAFREPPIVMPIFYGLAAFAATAANESALYRVASTEALVKAWVTLDSITGRWRAVVLAKDLDASEPLSVAFAPPDANAWPAARSDAPLCTLKRVAPLSGSAFAKSGIVFGGLTWDGTIDGTPTGTPVAETVTPSQGGAPGVQRDYAYRFSLPPLSMALLEWGALV